MNVDSVVKFITGIVRIRKEKTFSTYQATVAIGNNKSMYSIYNAVGSGVKIKIREIRLINNKTTAVTGIISDFRLKRFTTLHTVGTNLTAEAADTSDTLSASVTLKTGATIAGESATDLKRAAFSSDEWGTGTQDNESLQNISQQLGHPWYAPKNEEKPITLGEGQGLHIKHIVNSTAGNFDIYVLFTEEAA